MSKSSASTGSGFGGQVTKSNMLHHSKKRKLGRVRRQHTALLCSLARSIILYDGIETTEAKAKELRPFIEKLVTKSKTDSVASRRLVASRIGSERGVIKKLFETIAPKYKDRSGGYTRIVKTRRRADDAAKLARIDFV